HHVEALFQRLLPSRPLFRDRDAVAAELQDRRGLAGAEFDAAVGDKIERGNALGDARWMVVAGRHQHDAVAEPDLLGALRARGEEHFGRGGMGIFLEEVMLDLPRIVDADAVGEFDLLQCLAIDAMLGIRVPGTRQLMFVENAELHRPCSCGASPSLRYAVMKRSTRFSSGGRIWGWVKI